MNYNQITEQHYYKEEKYVRTRRITSGVPKERSEVSGGVNKTGLQNTEESGQAFSVHRRTGSYGQIGRSSRF